MPVSSTDILGALIEELDLRDCVIVLASGVVTGFEGLSSTGARAEMDLPVLIVLALLA